jgi:hypothetical protein
MLFVEVTVIHIREMAVVTAGLVLMMAHMDLGGPVLTKAVMLPVLMIAPFQVANLIPPVTVTPGTHLITTLP